MNGRKRDLFFQILSSTELTTRELVSNAPSVCFFIKSQTRSLQKDNDAPHFLLYNTFTNIALGLRCPPIELSSY